MEMSRGGGGGVVAAEQHKRLGLNPRRPSSTREEEERGESGMNIKKLWPLHSFILMPGFKRLSQGAALGSCTTRERERDSKRERQRQ